MCRRERLPKTAYADFYVLAKNTYDNYQRKLSLGVAHQWTEQMNETYKIWNFSNECSKFLRLGLKEIDDCPSESDTNTEIFSKIIDNFLRRAGEESYKWIFYPMVIVTCEYHDGEKEEFSFVLTRFNYCNLRLPCRFLKTDM